MYINEKWSALCRMRKQYILDLRYKNNIKMCHFRFISRIYTLRMYCNTTKNNIDPIVS